MTREINGIKVPDTLYHDATARNGGKPKAREPIPGVDFKVFADDE